MVKMAKKLSEHGGTSAKHNDPTLTRIFRIEGGESPRKKKVQTSPLDLAYEQAP